MTNRFLTIELGPGKYSGTVITMKHFIEGNNFKTTHHNEKQVPFSCDLIIFIVAA